MKLTMPANPLADIESSVGFGIAFVTTAGAVKLMAIPHANRAACVAAFAGVLRRVRLNGHGCGKRLVPNELLQLVVPHPQGAILELD
jgi:hypothetical protein